MKIRVQHRTCKSVKEESRKYKCSDNNKSDDRTKADSPAVLTSVQGHTEQDSGRQPGTNHMNNSRNPPPVPVRDLDRSKGKEGGQLTSISPASSQVWITAFITPQSIIRSSKWCRHASRQGSGGWEKVFDEVSGRPYYFNRSTRTTSWNLPEPSSPSPPPGSATHRKHEGGPVWPSLKRWPGSKSEQKLEQQT